MIMLCAPILIGSPVELERTVDQNEAKSADDAFCDPFVQLENSVVLVLYKEVKEALH